MADDEKDKLKIETTVESTKTTETKTGGGVSNGKDTAAGETPQTDASQPVGTPEPAKSPEQPNPVSEANKPVTEDQEPSKSGEQPSPAVSGTTKPAQAPKAEGDQSDISPSLKKGELEQKPNDISAQADKKDKKPADDKLGKGVKQAEEAGLNKAEKKGLGQVAKNAAVWVGRQLAAGAAKVAAALGGWWIAIAAVLLIVILIFGPLACSALNGYFGKSNPLPSGKNDPNIQLLVKKSITLAKSVTGPPIKVQPALVLTDEDKKFIEDGKADKRLLAILNYLGDKHSQINISSIISGFSDPNKKDPENIDDGTLNGASAHALGTAADVKSIDFVYKVDRPSESCQRLVASVCGPAAPVCLNIAKMLKIGNLAYYSDKNGADAAPTPDINTSLDNALDKTKFDAQKTILQNVQQTIEQTQGQYTDFTGKLTQSRDALVNFRTQNLSKLTGDQRNQLNTKIDNIQNALNQVNDISNQINGYKGQINDYQTKIDGLQNNLNSVKSTLVKVQQFNNALGANKDADLDKTINSIASTVNSVVSNLDTVDNQLGNINTVLTQTTSTIASQVQSAQSVIGQNQGDINSYLSNLNSLNITIDAGNVPLLFNVFSNGKQALDNFAQKIAQLAQSFVSKTVEQIVNEIKTTIKDQVQQVIDDQVNQVLAGLGLGGFDKNTLLLLPCVGFVVPGTADLTSTLGVDGAISDFTDSKLVSDINSGIDSAVGIVNTANDQLSQVSQSITSVQKTITTFTSQVTQLENAANQFAKNAGDTYLAQVNQAISTVQSTGNQNLDTLLKIPTQGQTGSQVCKSNTSSRDPSCTSSITDQQTSQQQTEARNQINIQQSQNKLLDTKTHLEATKTSLQNTLTQQGNKLSQAQQTQITQQIQSIQNTISQVDTWVAKIDAYKTQMDSINNKISSAQQSLTSISNNLLGVQNFVNNISGSIGGWIAKLIPSGFRAYSVMPNTRYKDQQYTEAVQIQTKWQDDPPDSKYINGEKDNKSILNALIYYTVYRPEAQRKVHELITQALNFDSTMGNHQTYLLTQLVTFNKTRDVTPFADLLDKLYGKMRPANHSLFNMPESWAHIHLAY